MAHPGVRIAIDRSRSLAQQPETGHNRWHPDIPAIARVRTGQLVEIETRDAVDCQVTPTTSAADLPNFRPNAAHALTGPVYIEGAQPGDLLAVHIDRIVPQPTGYTTFRGPHFGFLRDEFPYPFIAHWKIDGTAARSPQLPGITIPGAPFMGVMGVAPSHALLAEITAREAELAQRGGNVALPNAVGAVPAAEPIASTALRTVPPREFGGNFDIKQLVAGTTLYLPVYVEGALFSTGDAHFAQGDGESCGTAIEMGATFSGRFEVLSGEAMRRKQIDPSFSGAYAYDPVRRAGRPYYATTGSSVRKDGRNESEELNVAARNALLNMIDYLSAEHGYTRDQAYCICSVAVDLHISQIVDVPNFTVSAFLPLDIFGGR
ncbi:MAG: acetamidase/formamidase family protein [Candidatus Velthaea sp.]